MAIRFVSIRRSLIIQSAGLILGCLVTKGANAEVKVSRVDYHGWKQCYRMENGIIDMVVVPQVGHIMRFGYIGGPNMLWENPDLLGKTLTSLGLSGNRKDWVNFGGDKLWPAPQERWNWPPDPELDPGEHTVTITDKLGVYMFGEPSKKSGVLFRRLITMSPDSAEVTIVNTMFNSSNENQKWSVWEIAQTDNPDTAIAPKSLTGEPYNIMTTEKINPRTVVVVSGQVIVKRDTKLSGKIGTTNPLGWLKCTKAGTTFEMKLENQKGTYPDKDCRQQIYWNPDPLKYVELELLGPIKSFGSSAAISTTVHWSLQK